MFRIRLESRPEKFRVSQAELQRIAQELEREIEDIPQKGTILVSCTDAETIRQLNNDYRSKDAITDVLSFRYVEDFDQLGGETEIAGETIVYEERLLEQAAEYGISPRQEWRKLVIHSFLHILGYDHETDEDYANMQRLEDAIESRLTSGKA